MEAEHVELSDNPKEKANLLSSLLFCWTLPLFHKGAKKNLEIEDLYKALEKDRSNKLGDTLERNYTAEIEKCERIKKERNLDKAPKPSLSKALLKTFWKELVLLGLLIILNELILRLTLPVVLGKLLDYFKPHRTMLYEEALWWAGGIVILSAANVLGLNHYMLGCFHLGMRARVAVCSLIYRKSLKLSRTALGESAPGKVVNLLSNDVNRFDLVSVFLHYLWIAPLSSLIALYFIYVEVKISGVLGILVVFTVMPIQAYAGKLSSKFRLQTALKTDERVRLMGEIISGIQVIKMYAWEKPFQALITLARKLELKVIRKTSYVRAVYMTFLMTTTRIAVFCCMILMYFLHTEITASKMFVVATYFNLLSNTMSSMFVRAIAEIAEARVAMQRLQKYLLQDEFANTDSNRKFFNANIKSDSVNGNFKIDNDSKKPMTDVGDSKYAIKMYKTEAKWLPDDMAPTLSINELKIPKGKLVGVIGPIGCGKTSLLQMILGELPLTSGNIDINSTVSYACQEPWVFGASVRQNILFGLPYDKHIYNDVVKTCALLQDFIQFDQGDQTLIGERGTSLSGGQKARINLARAIYRNTEMYLLDDPLSAVDAHVGRHLFENCISKYLHGKTRILVTHQLHYLKDADYIILLKDGKIELQGTYLDMINSSLEFTTMLTPIKEDMEEEFRDKSRERHHSYSRRTSNRKNSTSSQHTHRSGSIASAMDITITTNEDDMQDSNEVQKIETEASSKDVVKGSVGMKYLKAGANFFLIFLLLMFFLLSQTMASAADYWMSFWTSQEEWRAFYTYNSTDMTYENMNSSLNTTPNPVYTACYNNTCDTSSADQQNKEIPVPPLESLMTSQKCMIIYGSIIISLLVCTFIRSISFYNVCLRASQRLHDNMFRGLVRSPLRFFNINPSGRIMNRFSKDMGAVDEILPKVTLDSMQMMLQMVGAIILACSVNLFFLAPIVVISLIFMIIRKYYLKTSKDIKRLEGIARSPVFTHLSATLHGLPTIRAYGAQAILRKEFDQYQDNHTSAHYLFITTSSAFGLMLDIMCLCLITVVTFSFLCITTGIFGNKVGLAITQTLSLTFLMQWGIRQSAEVSNQLMAVERLIEYTQLPPEKGIAPDETDIKYKTDVFEKAKLYKKPNIYWPENGEIQIVKLLMKYSENEEDSYVLRGLNCTIRSNEKVGIVGRTGAGKSSIISAMFRLAYNEGEIIIDNINTEEINLEDLRQKISIIPQDPVLFSGTLRRNLDPFEEYVDSAIWNALEEVELKDAIHSVHGLESRVMDGGSNFSVGQRQLICLARAILRNNRILMLDEATANVDPYTDNLIQRTIREKFAKCTVLTIAHRLNTIMDSDRVLVMDQGNIVEFAHPFVLLKNEHGMLYKMAQETGAQNLKILKETSRENYYKKETFFDREDIRMIDE